MWICIKIVIQTFSVFFLINLYSRNKGNCAVLHSLLPYLISNSDWNLCTRFWITVLHSNETKEFKLLSMSLSNFIYFSVLRKWKIKKLFFMLYFSFIPKWKFQERFSDHLLCGVSLSIYNFLFILFYQARSHFNEICQKVFLVEELSILCRWRAIQVEIIRK